MNGLGRGIQFALLGLLLPAVLVPNALAGSAYVTNSDSNNVSVINTWANQIDGSITVGSRPSSVAVTPDDKRVYVVNSASNSVSMIDTQTNQPVGSPIEVPPDFARGIAISPDGKSAYAASGESVSTIDIQANRVTGSIAFHSVPFGPTCSPFPPWAQPNKLAITPDGKAAYVSDRGQKSVEVIDVQTNRIVGSPIITGHESPEGIAITPDGKTAYVTEKGLFCRASNSVAAIDIRTNRIVSSITVGTGPDSVAITPDGKTAYVTNSESGTVSVIDTETNQVIGAPIRVGSAPRGIAITPDGKTAYVTNSESGTVSVIDTQTSRVIGVPIVVGAGPIAIAISPDQPPVAAFSNLRARPGVEVPFNAVGSSDPDGSIALYSWDFGDGVATATTRPIASHAYSKPGTYQARLTVTDDEGCSTVLIFTGQTAHCNGSGVAILEQTVNVAYPAVRVQCPRRVAPRRCLFKLQAFARKRRGMAVTRAAKRTVKAGRSAVVPLRPRAPFRVKLAKARRLLVKEKVMVGDSFHTTFHRLRIVQ